MKQQKLQQAPANLILEGYDTYAVLKVAIMLSNSVITPISPLTKTHPLLKLLPKEKRLQLNLCNVDEIIICLTTL